MLFLFFLSPASFRCRERLCHFLRKECVTIDLIPLTDRLRSLDETGCSDPAVLPKILQSWGNAPASYFFHQERLWERMQPLLDLSPEFASVITYCQMAWKIREMYESPPGRDKTSYSTFVEAVTLLGNAFVDCRPADAPCIASNRRIPLSERLKGPGGNLKPCILALRTQAMARAIDEMSGGKPMDYSRFVHENVAVHYVPEDEGKVRVGEVLDYANTLEAGKTAGIYLYLLVLPFTLI